MSSSRRRALLMIAATAPLGLLASGCGSLSADRTAAGNVARAFHSAVQNGNGAKACQLLAFAVAHDLKQSSGKTCPDAITHVGLTNPGNEILVDSYGHSAWAVFDKDTVFMSVFAGGWRVTAAGCTPRQARPYNCKLKGG